MPRPQFSGEPTPLLGPKIYLGVLFSQSLPDCSGLLSCQGEPSEGRLVWIFSEVGFLRTVLLVLGTWSLMMAGSPRPCVVLSSPAGFQASGARSNLFSPAATACHAVEGKISQDPPKADCWPSPCTLSTDLASLAYATMVPYQLVGSSAHL